MGVDHRIVGLALLIGIFAVGAEASASVRLLRRKTARGDYAVATVAANVSDPSALFVKVTARPNQAVDANWVVVCSKGSGAGSRDGQFSGVTPINRRVRMPYRNPDDCTFSAGAQLSGKGNRITVALLAR